MFGVLEFSLSYFYISSLLITIVLLLLLYLSIEPVLASSGVIMQIDGIPVMNSTHVFLRPLDHVG